MLASALAHGVAVAAAIVLIAPPEPEPLRPVGAWVAFAPSAAEPAGEAQNDASEAPDELPPTPVPQVPADVPLLPTVDAVEDDPWEGLPASDPGPDLPPLPEVPAPDANASVKPRRSPAPSVPLPPPAAAPRSAERGAVLAPPRPLATNRAPTYPQAARAHGLEGVVRLEITIEADGTVLAAWIETSSGHAILDRAAEEAVRSWRFAPALADGVPTRTTVRLPVAFRLS